MELKTKYLTTLGISLFLNVLSYIFLLFVLFMLFSFAGGFDDFMSDLFTSSGIETIIFLLILLFFVIGIIIIFIGGVLFYEVKSQNKLNKTLNLIYSISNMLSIPIGLILGIFMIIFGNEFNKNSLKKKKK